MRSSRVTPFLLSTLLCWALVAAGMGEGRLGMADDLESPVVSAPDQIEPEAPSRLSADLSDEIDQFDDCAEDYYYCYGYEYAAQQESSQEDADATDDGDSEENYAYEDEYIYDGYAWNDEDGEPEEESATRDDDQPAHDEEAYSYADEESYSYDDTEDYSYDSEEFVSDEPRAETDVPDDATYDYSEWDSEYGYPDYDDNEFAAEDTEDVAPQTADDTSGEEFSYDYDEFGSKYGDDRQDEYGYEYEEDDVHDCASDDNLLAADDANAEEESEETADQSQAGLGDDDRYDYEYDEEYSYDHEDGYMSEEYVHGSGEATESLIEDDVEDRQEEGFSYDYEDEYMGEEYDYDTREAAQGDVEDDVKEIQEDGFSYEYDNYDSQYGYEYMEEDAEPAEAPVLDAEAEGTEPSYDYGNWEDEYESEYESESNDYTTEYDEYGEYMYQPETEDVQADETESDSQFEQSGSWESEYDESAEWDSESEYSDFVNDEDEMEADTPAEDNLGVYGGYSEAYPEEEHAYPEPEARDVAQEEPESSCDADEFGYDCYDARMDPSEELAQDDYWTEYGYEYSYPETKYGSAGATEEESDIESRLEGEPGEPTYAMEECPEEDLPCGVELFAWHPEELLSHQDQEILKTLERLSEDPSGVRRATLNEYLEELGSDAVEFAGRFEDFSGIDVLGLADDLPGTAAFLASFRLLQRGELGIDETVDVLRHSLDNLSLKWIEGVREITADAFEDWDAGIDQSEDESADWLDVTFTARPIVVAMVSIANRSISGAKSAITTVSAQLSDMELSTVLSELGEN